ncbi:uncharacterized protein PV06_00497 [Exophiala oligosperma]|uniref:Thioredoxin domain-containing protein n=2 Tax=Chaetothyriales TaxID=34395 RepID=A0A0D2EIR9_9EURO|nr:uncharacterized protein PV06_00497 [Exophiala oligosperma]KAJ9634329.1 hypothetical protein H2204_006406 [Knufia peltigerae]KIW47839.1 hypothetical protein PV06_00497 [Exophiala oligosperma]
MGAHKSSAQLLQSLVEALSSTTTVHSRRSVVQCRSVTLPRKYCPPASGHDTTHTLRRRPFTTSAPLRQQNRVFNPFRTPSQFHDSLRLCSANNTLLLALFTTSTCTPCRTITPLLTSLVETRPVDPADRYSALAFAEVELDSPDMSEGSMMGLGVEWGVTSMPTLIGFGGRRAERVTDRLTDTRMLGDGKRMAAWVDEQMRKGDPFGTSGVGSGGGAGGGLSGRIFGG